MKLSKNLSLIEATKSYIAIINNIDNEPTVEHLENLKNTAEYGFQPIRDHFDVPIGVSSMYRSLKLDSKVGRSDSNRHTTGEAIDLDAEIFNSILTEKDNIILTNKMIFDWVRVNINFDTLTWEFGDMMNPGWVKIVLINSDPGTTQRKRVLRSAVVHNKIYYARM